MTDPYPVLRSQSLVLPVDDIDTDQIIPARFLKTTEREGLGAHLFADWRAAGPYREVFADPRATDCRILIGGDNFGCGSSREHAAWALRDFGIRAVVSSAPADIFASNAVKNGILPIRVDPGILRELSATPWIELEVDLENRQIRWRGGRQASFPIDGFARQCLLEGVDAMDWLLAREERIAAFERKRSEPA